jgi:flagellar biosynthesis protein FlhA
MGVSFAEAAHSYTLLTVGDGLVSQIPALVVSTAAGLLVAKAGVSDRTDRALFGQLSAHPRALATTSGLLALLAVLPGLPLVPFLLLSGTSGALAWHLSRRAEAEAPAAEEEAAAVAVPSEEPISTTLAMDPLRLELGYGLLPLIGAAGGRGSPIRSRRSDASSPASSAS